MADNVNQPAHYKAGGIETIDYIAANFGPEAFRDYCVGNVLKYASRWRHKNGIEDLRKASVYLLWAINGNPAVKLAAPKAETNGFKPGPAIDPPEHAPPPILEVIEAREADTPEDMGLNAEGAYREHA